MAKANTTKKTTGAKAPKFEASASKRTTSARPTKGAAKSPAPATGAGSTKAMGLSKPQPGSKTGKSMKAK